MAPRHFFHGILLKELLENFPINSYVKLYSVVTPVRRQLKTPILLRNIDQNSIETVFLIAICRQCGDKWESKTLFLLIFDPRLSIVDNVFDCRLPDVVVEC